MKATAPILQLLVVENVLWISTGTSTLFGFGFIFLALRNVKFTPKPQKPPLRFYHKTRTVFGGAPSRKNAGYRLGTPG